MLVEDEIRYVVSVVEPHLVDCMAFVFAKLKVYGFLYFGFVDWVRRFFCVPVGFASSSVIARFALRFEAAGTIAMV